MIEVIAISANIEIKPVDILAAILIFWKKFIPFPYS
jgi:hypothetical protein